MESLLRLSKVSDAAASLWCWIFCRPFANNQLVYMRYTKSEAEKYRIVGDFGELQDNVLWDMNVL